MSFPLKCEFLDGRNFIVVFFIPMTILKEKGKPVHNLRALMTPFPIVALVNVLAALLHVVNPTPVLWTLRCQTLF